jgi:hypothetical protein
MDSNLLKARHLTGGHVDIYIACTVPIYNLYYITAAMARTHRESAISLGI